MLGVVPCGLPGPLAGVPDSRLESAVLSLCLALARLDSFRCKKGVAM